MFEILAVIWVTRVASRGENVPAKKHSCARRFLSRLTCYTPQFSESCTSGSEEPPSSPSRILRADIKIYPTGFKQMPSKTRINTATLPRIRGSNSFNRINSASSTETSDSGPISPTASPSSVTSSDSTTPLQQDAMIFTWKDIARMWSRLFIAMFVFVRLVVIATFLAANSAGCGHIFCKY